LVAAEVVLLRDKAVGVVMALQVMPSELYFQRDPQA
jgi:hypothetical protein